MTMTEIKPALSKEEWDEWFMKPEGAPWGLNPERPHASAAICLYGQPFGLTREDVELARTAAEAPDQGYELSDDESRRLRSLAARIEALLPPE